MHQRNRQNIRLLILTVGFVLFSLASGCTTESNTPIIGKGSTLSPLVEITTTPTIDLAPDLAVQPSPSVSSNSQFDSPIEDNECVLPDIGGTAPFIDWHWSPDGSQIGLLLDTALDKGVLVIDVSTALSNSLPLKLAQLPREILIPSYGGFAWFPDGERFVISQRSCANNMDSCSQLVVGSEDQKYVPLIPDFNWPQSNEPTISPDGRYVAFTAGRYESRLYLYDFLTKQVSQLSEFKRPWGYEWSPDSQKIAFRGFQVVPSNDYVLHVIDVQTQTEIELFTDSRCASNHQWSPDGNEILLDLGDANNRELYLLQPDSHQLRPLTNTPAHELQSDWSPLGDAVVFVSHTIDLDIYLPQDGTQDVFSMNLERGEMEQLTFTPELFETRPQWSPDGRFIGFFVWDVERHTATFDIIDVQTGKQYQLLVP